MRALCGGVVALLERYRSELLLVEQEVLQTRGTLPVSAVYAAMEEWRQVLPATSALVEEVVAVGGARGGGLLDALERRAKTGMPVVRAAFEGLLVPCRCVLLSQIGSWALHGILHDPCDEFFVGGGVGESAAAGEVWTAYRIRSELLPACLPLRVAEGVLFAGKTLAVFQRAGGGAAVLEPAEAAAAEARLAELQAAAPGRFQSTPLAELVDFVRQRAAARLWSVVAEHGGLLPALEDFRAYMLVGKGELFAELDVQGGRLLDRPVVRTTLHDARSAWGRAASALGCEDSPPHQMFTLTLNPPRAAPPGRDVDTEDGWAALGLEARLGWPLSLVFTPEAIAGYNAVFPFLLRVARVQRRLGDAWAAQMRRGRLRGPAAAPSASAGSRLLRLRANMSFLLGNLLSYLQGDVVDAQHELLLQRAAAARGFDDFLAAHGEFLTALRVQTFRSAAPVRNLLAELLRLGESLCALLDKGGVALTPTSFAELDRIEQAFAHQAAFLFRLLSSVGSAASATGRDHLAQLLLRLDYNGWLSRSSAP